MHAYTCDDCNPVPDGRRYEKAQKPLAAFEADMRRYAELAEEILLESAHEPIRFLNVDCGPLKQVCQHRGHTALHAALLKSAETHSTSQALLGHCEAWTGKFTSLLGSVAARELGELHAYVRANTAALQQPVQDLRQVMAAAAASLHGHLTEQASC